MRAYRFLVPLFAAVLFSPIAMCQMGLPMAPAPSDPLELAGANAQTLIEPAQRAAALQLLDRARQDYTLYASDGPAFNLHVSFTSNGQSQYEGAGSMQETWVRRGLERWTSQIGGTSQFRVFNGGVWGESVADPVPMRVQMVRGALLWPVKNVAPRATIRSASANFNGLQLTCVLVSEGGPSATGPRQWSEREYCIDPETGLLHTWSEAPGLYFVYDYDDAIQFHGHNIARQITANENGNVVLQIHIDSLQDAGQVDSSIFQPTQAMLLQGLSFTLQGPQVSALFARGTPGSRPTIIQPVMIHATISPAGQVVESEALQNSFPALSEAALDLVKTQKYPPMRSQRELLINVQFLLSQQNGGANPQ